MRQDREACLRVIVIIGFRIKRFHVYATLWPLPELLNGRGEGYPLRKFIAQRDNLKGFTVHEVDVITIRKPKIAFRILHHEVGPGDALQVGVRLGKPFDIMTIKSAHTVECTQPNKTVSILIDYRDAFTQQAVGGGDVVGAINIILPRQRLQQA